MSSRPLFIANAAVPKVLDLSNDDRTTILAWPKNGGANQQWVFVPQPNSDGLALIRNPASGRYLNIRPDNSTVFGGSSTQDLWRIEERFQKDGWIILSAGGQILEVDYDNGSVQLELFDGYASTHQIWDICEVFTWPSK